MALNFEFKIFMKKNYVLIFIFLLPFIVKSQYVKEENETMPFEFKKHSLGINIGGSSSLGDFGDKDLSNEDSGLAEGGAIFNINYQYQWDKNLAFTAEYGGIGHTFAAQEYAEFIASDPLFLGNSVSVSANPYGYGYLTIGIKAITGEKYRAYLNPSFGLSSIISPEVLIVTEFNGGNSTAKIRESEPTAGLCFGVGFGGEIQVSSLISLSLDFDYYTSKHEITQELETVNQNGIPILLSGPFDLTYSSFSTSVGVKFSF